VLAIFSAWRDVIRLGCAASGEPWGALAWLAHLLLGSSVFRRIVHPMGERTALGLFAPLAHGPKGGNRLRPPDYRSIDNIMVTSRPGKPATASRRVNYGLSLHFRPDRPISACLCSALV
jgi:hypothetical protein